MADFVIPPPAISSVPVAGGGAFPVRRVFCVGRNYAEHAREMGSDPDREPPFFFMKPADALLIDGADMPYPPQSNSLHHEMELVVALGEGGADIAGGRRAAPCLGLCRRPRHDPARPPERRRRRKESPGTWARASTHSAPIGLMVPAAKIGHPAQGLIELKVNGAVRQTSDLSKMIWDIPETIAYLSRLVRLAPGDLIFTGTPEGVAAVQRGDLLEGVVEGVGTVRTRIV